MKRICIVHSREWFPKEILFQQVYFALAWVAGYSPERDLDPHEMILNYWCYRGHVSMRKVTWRFCFCKPQNETLHTIIILPLGQFKYSRSK